MLAAVVVDHQLLSESTPYSFLDARLCNARPKRAAATRISARSGSNDFVVILDLAAAIGTPPVLHKYTNRALNSLRYMLL